MATDSKIHRPWTPASPTTMPGPPYIAVAQTSPRPTPTWSGYLFGAFGERLEPATWPTDFGIWNSSADRGDVKQRRPTTKQATMPSRWYRCLHVLTKTGPWP